MEKNTAHDWKEQFSTNIQIVRTPGHDYTGITLFVKTGEGIVAVCGDIFWKENYPEDPQDDAYASDIKKLKESRDLVLKMADWIIPGHAGMYKNSQKDAASREILITEEVIDKKQDFSVCKRCKRPLKGPQSKCVCRPWFCYHCCECGLDCDACSCSHKEE